MILKRFYPDYAVDSAYVIPYEQLYEQGIRGIIYDIDNTLVPHGAPADERSIALMKRLKSIGYSVVLLSNNKRERVESFANCHNLPFIEKANKPSRKNYLRAMAQMGTNEENTIFVGDQLFTDVYGGKRTGVISYLVKPINPKEEIQIVLKRYLEKIVLHYYRKEKGGQ